jgi:hypothetical protein
MINYIIVGLIGILTIYVIYRQIKKVKEGKCFCDETCSGCASKSSCNIIKNEKK